MKLLRIGKFPGSRLSVARALREEKREAKHLVGVGVYPGAGNVCDVYRNGGCTSV